MTKFENTQWASGRFPRIYRESADSYLPERHRLIEITLSLYEHYLAERPTNRVLDLGCGDGLFMHELMRTHKRIEATLVDPSPEMLDAAQKRLAGFERARFVRASFQELLVSDLPESTFDFILSSFAIHHLEMDEKEALFRYVYTLLNPGGFFLIIDVVAAPTQELEDWYLRMWRDWIETNADDSVRSRFLDIPQHFRDDPDDHPDTLSAQATALEKIGFRNVACHYQFGMFAAFSGNKES